MLQVQYLRGFDEANVKGVRRQKYTFKKVRLELRLLAGDDQFCFREQLVF